MGRLGVFGGFVMLVVSGILNGSAVTPLKYARKSIWESLWLIQSIVVIILPWFLVWATVPDPVKVYRESGWGAISIAIAFGVGWGVGNLLYIVGVVMVGLSVSFAIILSLTATLGALFPILILRPHELDTPTGHQLLVALILTIVGIVLCAYAGAGRIKQDSEIARQHAGRTFWLGIVICVLSGIFSPMMNFAFVFGDRITVAALQSGAQQVWAPNALWAIVFTAAFIINAIYCIRRLGISASWTQVREAPFENLFLGSIMGVLNLVSTVTYGIGADAVGKWGASSGWAVNMCVTIIAANVWGLLTGEWKNASRKSCFLLAAGLASISISIVLASVTND